MALVFDERGLLPPGVHDATMEEVGRYLARFQRSDRRLKLMAKLRHYLAEVKKAIPGAAVVSDGSFVMACVDEPGDVDLVLLLPPDWDTDAELGVLQYNVVSKRRVQKDYKFDVFAFPSGSEKADYWVTFFSQISPQWREQYGWPDDARKGLVRVSP